jgi:hypothetical protein
MATNIVKQDNSIFDSIRRFDKNGNEFWMARDLMKLLEYKEWRKFDGSISRSKLACMNAGFEPGNHFVPSDNLVKRVQGGGSVQSDFKLSRYACYLVAMNGDPRKTAIAQAQTYFAVKTREAETVIPAQSVEMEKLRLESENLKLQLALAKEQNKLSDSQSKLLATVHLLETVSPGLAPLALGKADAVVERIEYVERTITDQGAYEGVGITYIQKKYGFKSTKATWAWLDTIGCGKDSGMWQLQLSAVESHKLPPYALAEIAKRFSDGAGDRQLLLGE